MRKIRILSIEALLLLLSIGATYNIAQNKFQYGDRVTSTTNLNVRSTPGGSSLGLQSTGSIGSIIGGPQTALLNGTSYIWYQVQWSSSPTSGWSAENNLEKVVAQIGTVTMISPNGGESWTAGTSHSVSWSVSGNIDAYIDLQYTTDNGSSWNVLTSGLGKNSSPYTWSVPSGINSTLCKTKVLGYFNGNNTTDASNSTFTITSPAQIGTVTMISPNGGESWTAGTSHSVSWSVSGNIDAYIDLQYTTDNGSSWNVLTSGLGKNSSPYTWSVPSGINSTLCKTKVLGYFNGNNTTDASNSTFTITSPAQIGTVTMISPNGGESWTAGTSHSVSWSVSGNIDAYIDLQYTTDNGSSWNVLTSGLGKNSSPYTWSVPSGINSTLCKTKVLGYFNGNNTTDASNSTFTITSPAQIGTVTMISPNGGESWTAGTSHSVSWSVSGNIDAYIDLQYTTDNGSSWNVLTSGLGKNSSPYTWSVPSGINSTLCKTKVLGYFNGNNTTDASNSTFTITSPAQIGTVTMISPNGGESWTAGTSHSVSWSVSGNIDAYIDLQYTTDNGSSWNVLTSGLGKNSSPYTWSVPSGINSTLCKTKVLGYFNGNNTTDASNSTFTIKQVDESTITTINFANMKWNVRGDVGGPGPNNWYNGTNSVWVDNSGNLHLKIRKIGDKWYCSEIYAQDVLGYGEYTFYVSSNVEQYDPNIAVGLFNYENNLKEIDIEFSRWGSANNNSGWYVIQPSTSASSISFPLNLNGTFSTHKFIWKKESITFQSYYGHYDNLPSSANLIKEWIYSGPNNPTPNALKPHINFWLMNGLAPQNQNEAELIISGFTYKPPSQSNATKIKLTNIYVQRQGDYNFKSYPLRTALGIKLGDKIRFEGIVLDNDNKPINNQPITVYNSIKYKSDQSNSKENIFSNADGKFYYPSPDGSIELNNVEGGVFPFWFKINSDNAIPFDLVIMDKSTTVDEINKTLQGLISPNGPIRNVKIDMDNKEFSELFIPAEAYPPDDGDLLNNINDNFWKFFTSTYSGPVDEHFLISSDDQNGWLKRGLDCYFNSVKKVLNSLPERFSTLIPTNYNNSSNNRLNKSADYDPSKTSNLIQYGIEGLVCASTFIPTGVTQAIGPIGCEWLGAHIATDVVKYIYTSDYFQKPFGVDGNDELDASIETFIDIGTLLYSTDDIPKHIDQWQNPRNLAHGGVAGRLKANTQMIHDLYDIEKTDINFGEMSGQHYKDMDGNYKGSEYFNIMHSSGSSTSNYLNLNFTRAFKPSLIINKAEFNNTTNPTYLEIEVESSRPVYRKGLLEQTTPSLRIGNTSFSMEKVNNVNSTKFLYRAGIPVSQLPNFSPSNPLNWFEVINASGTSFETMGGVCSGGVCGSKAQTLFLKENSSSNSLHKTVGEDFIARLDVPQNAFGSQSSFVGLSLEPANQILNNSQNTLINNSSIININTNAINFNIPSVLQLPLNSVRNTTYDGLSVYLYNEQKSEWEKIITSINYTDSVAIASIVNQGKYSLMFSSSNTTNIMIDAPNGGEEWEGGTTQTITWMSTGISMVKLEYSTNNGSTWNIIATNISAVSGSYEWVIPNTLSTQCKVRISNTIDDSLFDMSNNNFKIIKTNTNSDPCGGITTITYLGKVYHTVALGSQCWLKENLDVGTIIQGNLNQSNNGIIEKYCYNNDPNNCTIYGGLYQWNEAMAYSTSPGTKGICPNGWHIPTKEEFETLSKTVNNDGNSLKEVGQGIGAGVGTNTSGFSGLLAGWRMSDGNFSNIGGMGHFWVSEYWDATIAVLMNLFGNEWPPNIGFNPKEYGYCLRCIKDEITSSVDGNNEKEFPTVYSLSQNYPNPFNPSTNIKYSIPSFCKVSLKVFDILGREVLKLVDEEKSIGQYEVVLNGKNLASGVYFYRLQAGNFSQTRKLILLK